jgi:hypothetical protein
MLNLGTLKSAWQDNHENNPKIRKQNKDKFHAPKPGGGCGAEFPHMLSLRHCALPAFCPPVYYTLFQKVNAEALMIQ